MAREVGLYAVSGDDLVRLEARAGATVDVYDLVDVVTGTRVSGWSCSCRDDGKPCESAPVYGPYFSTPQEAAARRMHKWLEERTRLLARLAVLRQWLDDPS